jgi:hypothetical protein
MSKIIKFEKGKKREFKNHSGSSDFEGSLLPTMTRIANRYNGNKELILMDLREVTPSEFKLGYGGNHIWCANQKNERVFILEGY